MSAPKVVVLDYGSGNLRSAQRALERVGAQVQVTADADAALDCDGLAVPGVGAFAACMTGLRSVGGDKLITQRLERGRPVLGICVGMQVLFAAGVEHGIWTEGCAAWPGTVERLDAGVLPHMGWNTVAAALAPRCSTGSRPAPGSTSCTPTRSGRQARVSSPPPAPACPGPSTASGSRPPPSRGTVRDSVPPGEVRRCRRRRPVQLARPAMTGLTLLPAVDVTDGHAVQLVQGVAGSGGQYGDPMAAALAWQRAARRGSTWWTWTPRSGAARTRTCSPRSCGKLDVQVEMSGGIRDDDSLARALAHRLRAGQHRHRGAGAPGLGALGDRPARRAGRGRAGRPGHPAGRRRLDRRGGELYRRWTGWTPRAAPGTSSPTYQGRHPARAQPGPAADVCARTTAPVVASGGVPAWPTAGHRLARAAGRGGRDRRHRAVRGGFTLEEALAEAGHR